MEDLALVKSKHPSDVEICISDNHSTDETSNIIASFSRIFEFLSYRQSSNIGAALNFKFVSQLASGNWVLSIGDDDRLDVESFSLLVNQLKSINSNTWILIDTYLVSGRRLLGGIRQGSYKGIQPLLLLLARNIDRFGFLGSHLIPRDQLLLLDNFDPSEIFGWPHLYLFLSSIYRIPVSISSLSVVFQAPEHVNLFWKKSDWFRINHRKLPLILSSKPPGYSIISLLYIFLAIRFLYSPGFLTSILSCKIYEPKEFPLLLNEFFLRRISTFGFSIFLFPLFMFFYILRIIPNWFLFFLFPFAFSRDSLLDYNRQKIDFVNVDSSARKY